MAKCIWICSRNRLPQSVFAKISHICQELTPDNIVPVEPVIQVSDKVAFGIMNPTRTILFLGNSLMIGKILNENEGWHIPMADFPDGSYALFRDGEEYCEIVSDPVGSRTIWYYMNEEVFIASTSQRAIILYLGRFEFNEAVIPWMLSTGSLGPGFSWDKRISQLTPDSSVILDKGRWTVKKIYNPVIFDVDRDTEKDYNKELRETLNSTFGLLNIEYKDWVLPLSGGYDSRGILCILHESGKMKGLRTITWGLESALEDKRSDAWVAKKLADHFRLSHEYFHTNAAEEPMETLIERFFLNGEGRIDHLSGYMDGFKIWKTIFDAGIQGIIRGDSCFGNKSITSPLTVKIAVGLRTLSDFSNLDLNQKFNLPKQEFPEHLKIKPGESLETWRDRLYFEFRLPSILAALSDLKLSYVEQVNPLLFKKIIRSARKMPDHVRTERVVFKKIVEKMSPGIHYADREATASYSNIMKEEALVELVDRHLRSEYARILFDANLLDHVLDKISINRNNAGSAGKIWRIISIVKSNLPKGLRNIIRDKVSFANKMDYYRLAFRMFLIIRMHQILSIGKVNPARKKL